MTRTFAALLAATGATTALEAAAATPVLSSAPGRPAQGFSDADKLTIDA